MLLRLAITGDFNIPMDSSTSSSKSFSELLSAYNLTQHINVSTHNRGHVLDLLITHKDNTVQLTNIGVNEGISDHAAIMCEFNIPKRCTKKKLVTTRNLKSVDPKQFVEDSHVKSLISTFSYVKSVDEEVNMYNFVISSALDKLASEKQLYVTIRPNTEWYNQEIAQAKLLRRQLERKFRSTKLEIHRQMYRTQKQHVDDSIKKAQADYH